MVVITGFLTGDCNIVPPSKERLPDAPDMARKVQEGGKVEAEQGVGWSTRSMKWKRA